MKCMPILCTCVFYFERKCKSVALITTTEITGCHSSEHTLSDVLCLNEHTQNFMGLSFFLSVYPLDLDKLLALQVRT